MVPFSQHVQSTPSARRTRIIWTLHNPAYAAIRIAWLVFVRATVVSRGHVEWPPSWRFRWMLAISDWRLCPSKSVSLYFGRDSTSSWNLLNVAVTSFGISRSVSTRVPQALRALDFGCISKSSPGLFCEVRGLSSSGVFEVSFWPLPLSCFLPSPPTPAPRNVLPPNHPFPENAKGGGKKRGGGQNLTRRPPVESSFRPPSPRYVLPPPIPFLLVSPLQTPRISLRWPPQKAFSEGLEEWFPTGHPREVLLFGAFCPPPFSSAQPFWKPTAPLFGRESRNFRGGKGCGAWGKKTNCMRGRQARGPFSAFAKRGACKRGLRKLRHRAYQLHSNYIPETWSNHDCHWQQCIFSQHIKEEERTT